ncbi:hypothetical protein CWE56_20010 [Salmonella enterica]|nr:hypothetical protein [Salmonella enterica]EBU4613131.1 hypothetical protein [Salmonella enterica]
MGSCAAPSAKGDDKFITTDYLQQCRYTYCPGKNPEVYRFPHRNRPGHSPWSSGESSTSDKREFLYLKFSRWQISREL